MKSSAEYRASVAVLRYCPPVLLALGTFGNLTTVIILRRMKMKRSAMPVYLTALALSDTSLLYTGLLRYWVINVFDLDVRTVHPAVCKVHTWLVYSLIIISAWILTFMTVERTICVWKPHRVSVLCTRVKATVIVVCVVMTSLSVNSHLLYGLDVVQGPNGTRLCFAPDPDYLQFFDTVWAWVDLTLASLIPFGVLLVGNTLILCRIYSSVKSAHYLCSVRGNVKNDVSNDVTQRQKTMSSMTVTLVALSVIFFMTTSPICVYNIAEHYIDMEAHDAIHGPGGVRLAWAIVNILMYINNSVNFYLYCLSGTNFRRELRRCLCCRSEPPHGGQSNARNHDHYPHHHNANSHSQSRPSHPSLAQDGLHPPHHHPHHHHNHVLNAHHLDRGLHKGQGTSSPTVSPTARTPPTVAPVPPGPALPRRLAPRRPLCTTTAARTFEAVRTYLPAGCCFRLCSRDDKEDSWGG